MAGHDDCIHAGERGAYVDSGAPALIGWRLRACFPLSALLCVDWCCSQSATHTPRPLRKKLARKNERERRRLGTRGSQSGHGRRRLQTAHRCAPCGSRAFRLSLVTCGCARVLHALAGGRSGGRNAATRWCATDAPSTTTTSMRWQRTRLICTQQIAGATQLTGSLTDSARIADGGPSGEIQPSWMDHAMTWWCSRATAKSNERCIVAVAIRLHVNDRRRAPLRGYCVLSILVLSIY